MRLYLDDSGTRHPDRDTGQEPAHGHDWFGLGGVVLRDRDMDALEIRHSKLCETWGITYPLHSSEIRAMTANFRWLHKRSKDERVTFFADIAQLVTSPELTAIACVIDRPGYNQRYREKFGRRRWSLCKTAFTVVVERAAKFARDNGCKLRVYVEKSDKTTDRTLLGYYEELRADGHPFDKMNAEKYHPLTSAELHETLYEFKAKDKSSRMMQLADIVLWPMCIGGYDRNNRSYVALQEAGTLIDSKLAPQNVLDQGIKYYCWELELDRRKDQSPVS